MAKKYNSAEKRWEGIGPYYAMFPTTFANRVIKKYTEPGDVILDPFAGRATSIYSAAINKRIGIGIELNPVGWVYGKTKLLPCEKDCVKNRIDEIKSISSKYWRQEKALPEFFHLCFSRNIRMFLLAARDQLNWRKNSIDWTTMALLLVYLHGKQGQALSNQMRQTKSMSQNYAIAWWKKRKLKPPEIDPVEFMFKRIEWRYAKGTPYTTKSQVFLGDSNCIISKKVESFLNQRDLKSVKMLFTSPPYCGVTNYHYDQWLRLWLLGHPPVEYVKRAYTQGRFAHKEKYFKLLLSIFSKASKFLKKDAVIYIRTDAREFTYLSTIKALNQVFPKKKIVRRKKPFNRPTQTHLFGDTSPKDGEIDLILRV